MSERRIALRYPAQCVRCQTALNPGTEAFWDSGARTASCLECPAALTPEPSPRVFVSGIAGASARREGARRSTRREERIQQQFGRLSGLVMALSDDPQATKAWGQGAVGEERLAKILNRLSGAQLHLLHDRRIPRTRANIDHIAVAPSGVYVIDAKHYSGRVERRKPLFARSASLLVGGRDQTKLVPGIEKQVEVVRDATSSLAPLPIKGVLCFVGAEWGLFRQPFTVGAVDILWPEALAKRLTTEGPLTPEVIEAVSRVLEAGLPSA